MKSMQYDLISHFYCVHVKVLMMRDLVFFFLSVMKQTKLKKVSLEFDQTSLSSSKGLKV